MFTVVTDIEKLDKLIILVQQSISDNSVVTFRKHWKNQIPVQKKQQKQKKNPMPVKETIVPLKIEHETTIEGGFTT